MTRPNYREGHPIQNHKPNLYGHEQKQVGKATLKNTQKRHDEFVQRFFSNKDFLVKDSLGRIIFDIPEEIIVRDTKKQ